VRRYWYFITEDYCPLCGRTQAWRERRYTKRPKLWKNRHRFTEAYDGCGY